MIFRDYFIKKKKKNVGVRYLNHPDLMLGSLRI